MEGFVENPQVNSKSGAVRNVFLHLNLLSRVIDEQIPSRSLLNSSELHTLASPLRSVVSALSLLPIRQ